MNGYFSLIQEILSIQQKNKTIEKYIENIGTEFQIIKVFDIFSSQEKKYTHRLLVKAMSLKNNVNKIII